MENKLCNKLFDFDIKTCKKISINKGELYNQLLLYIFFNVSENIVLVYSTLNEANDVYNELKRYIDDVFLYPEDDYIIKNAIASSPEFLFMKSNLLNNINNLKKKIIIVHLNSFIKKLPPLDKYKSEKIHFKVGDLIDRNKLVDKLIHMGYKKESIVYNLSEFSIRGFVIDIFPINVDNPIRVELFDDKIVSIKFFNNATQKTINKIEQIDIPSILIEENNECNSSILDYLKNSITIYNNYNQIILQEKMIQPQIKYLNFSNKVFKLSELLKNNDIFINTIDNNDFDIVFDYKKIENYNSDKKQFINDIINNNGVLYSKNNLLNRELIKYNITIIKENLNSGFIYNNNYFFSENDLFEKKYSLEKNIKDYGIKISSLDNLKLGDYVVHKKSGIGIYSGLIVLEKNGLKKDYLLIEYKGNDKLYLPVEDISKIYKYAAKEGKKPTINKLNSLEWTKTKLKIKERIKNITGELIRLYKERNNINNIPYKKDDENQILFESEFDYEETTDQLKAIAEIKKDLESNKPMERLLCGDVGYGKTEVIFRAIFKTVINNKQVVYLCPTTLLAEQQYNVAKYRFRNFGVNFDIISRQYNKKEILEKIKKLKDGKIDVIFGTHRLLSNDINFKDLGLLVIDEEHKFGVEQKEKIKKLKSNVNILSVSATPIPRSLQMSLTGIRDLSLIESAPKNRYPVQTYVIKYDNMLIRDILLKEKSRNGQSFILYNKVIDMGDVLNKYKKLVPELKFCFAHGKMNKSEMQMVVDDFKSGISDVLISTTIIENGIDIPNANTMIVIDADNFGLSQLYQIRGRVGRSDKIAYAYFMYNENKMLNSNAVKRLDAIKEFTELGSGYKISMRDLAIRGAGDILGKEQAGFIDTIGVDMYLELLNEEITGKIDGDDYIAPIDVETHINQNIVNEDDLIIELHKKIDNVKNKNDIKLLIDEINDRYGYIDEKLKIYIHEKYVEKLLKLMDIKIFENNNIKVILKINDNICTKIKMDKLFIESMKISHKINFEYKNNFINIIILKASLSKHYIYILEDLLELIIKLKN